MMENVKYLYETTQKTLQQIADECGVSMWKVHSYVKKNYSQEHRKGRKVINYSKSKQGNKNPMLGKCGDSHHNYIGDISDGKGYLMRVKPIWYSGRKGCKHVFTHHIVMCEALGLTEIPEGYCVHHIDGNKTNNNLNNLELMTKEAHARLHSLERATTRVKTRRA